ncbi:TIGR02647 family protein [Oceanicoccus sp. KOV_DT_Chl]|uniref:TIGR02647 family protein n=1 Tax=Oceanicoccus sp. KOV_DT_Chl TaxID=1904639 RepID=UPI000C7A6963|nr:TIGR02647 family protein [Oceanicoccus sp. KOV_DT_Chl]
MLYSAEIIEELNILARYNLDTTQEGIKVHTSEAANEVVAATERLFNKGLISQQDGGYLTGLGRDAAEHAQNLLIILNK